MKNQTVIPAPEFQIRKIADFNADAVIITESEFLELSNARLTLNYVSQIEENFWILCEAYREYSDATLLLANRLRMYSNDFFIEVPFYRAKLGAKFDFLLAAFSRYYEATYKALKKFIVKDQFTILEQKKTEIKTQNFEFLLCLSLRNFGMHQSTAADGIRFSASRPEINGLGELSVENSISPENLKDFLVVKSSQNDKLLLDALAGKITAGTKSIDISTSAVKALSLVAQLHNEIRKVMGDSENSAHATFLQFKKCWGQNKGDLASNNDLLAEKLTHKDEECLQIPFEVPDDASVLQIRKLTTRIDKAVKSRVCSSPTTKN